MIRKSSELQIHVIGAGLIGTSIALAAKELGHFVTIEDANTRVELLARDLIKNHSEADSAAQNLIVVVAVPPLVSARVISAALDRYPRSIVIDVASAKTKVVLEVESLSVDSAKFIPTHPIAGREVAGPKAAQADLFVGRAWVITPHEGNSQDLIQEVSHFISSLGASVYVMSCLEHDELFAQISHLPQLVSSALASLLAVENDGFQLAGQGLRDTTRLAESDSSLWREIVEANQSEVLKALKLYREVIDQIVRSVESGDYETIAVTMEQGRLGRQRISGKHGALARRYSIFHIVIDDRPGVLGELFSLMAKHEINIEDLDIEHSPNQETGLISISVSPDQESRTSSALKAGEWTFHLEGSDA